MKRLKYLIQFIVFVLLTIFAVANSHKTQVYYWDQKPIIGEPMTTIEETDIGEETEITQSGIPVFLLVFIAFGAGWVISWLYDFTRIKGIKKDLKKTRKQLRKKDTEMETIQQELKEAQGPEMPQETEEGASEQDQDEEQ